MSSSSTSTNPALGAGSWQTPGVIVEERWTRAPVLPDSGVPLFVGSLSALAATFDSSVELKPLSSFAAFELRYGSNQSDSVLARSLRGYFANGGGPCFVLSSLAEDAGNLASILETSLSLEGVDLVCVPGLTTLEGQKVLLAHALQSGERFVLLDAPLNASFTAEAALSAATQHAQSLQSLPGASQAALYFPWVKVAEGDAFSEGRGSRFATVLLPPSGLLAGLYSRLDREVGVQSAMANVTLAGALDVTAMLDAPGLEQDASGALLNLLKPTRRRGIVPWGCRTLSADPQWAWVNTRRLVLTVARHARTLLEQLAFEINDIRTWMRVHRSLGNYLSTLYQAGALIGQTPGEAWFVKCDDENNPLEVRNQGQLIVELGLAPTRPLEYIVLRILHSADQTIISQASPSDASV